MSQIEIKGRTYPIEFDSLTVAELRFAATQLKGADTRKFLEGVNNLDLDSLVTFARIALKRAGEDVKSSYFDDVPLLQLVPKDQPAAEEPDPPTEAAPGSKDAKAPAK